MHLVPVGPSVWERNAPRVEALAPVGLELDAARLLAHVLVDAVGDDEVLVRVPAEHLLGRAHLVLAERVAVGLGGVDCVGRRVGDVRVGDDQARPVRFGMRGGVRGAQLVEVVHVVDVLDVPAVGLEPGALVLNGEGERGRAVDRDPVVVVEVGQLAEAEVAGDRGCFRGDALHQVAIGADAVDPVVDDASVRPVVALRQEALREPEADAVRDALSERAGGGLDPGREEVLGVPGCARAPLAELLQVVQG